MNQISTSYLPPPYCFFFLEGFREKIREIVCSARDFRFAKSGILREFLRGQDFGKSRSQKKFPQNSRCFEPLNHCYDWDLPDFFPIPVFFIGGGGVISESLTSPNHKEPHSPPTPNQQPCPNQHPNINRGDGRLKTSRRCPNSLGSCPGNWLPSASTNAAPPERP
jgi:hypothetical protein